MSIVFDHLLRSKLKGGALRWVAGVHFRYTTKNVTKQKNKTKTKNKKKQKQKQKQVKDIPSILFQAYTD